MLLHNFVGQVSKDNTILSPLKVLGPKNGLVFFPSPFTDLGTKNPVKNSLLIGLIFPNYHTWNLMDIYFLDRKNQSKGYFLADLLFRGR